MIGGREKGTNRSATQVCARSPGSSCAAIPTTAISGHRACDSRTTTRRSRAGGCDFAADARLPWSLAYVFWRPDIAADVLSFATSPITSSGAPTAAELLLGARFIRRADDGVHALSPDDTQLWIIGVGASAGPLAALLPLGPGFARRTRALARFNRALHGDNAQRSNDGLSARARGVFTLRLRALDGNLERASRREIAVALFGRDRVPAGAAWKSHDLRSRTMRLVSQGRALMEGGYLDLLR